MTPRRCPCAKAMIRDELGSLEVTVGASSSSSKAKSKLSRIRELRVSIGTRHKQMSKHAHMLFPINQLEDIRQTTGLLPNEYSLGSGGEEL